MSDVFNRKSMRAPLRQFQAPPKSGTLSHDSLNLAENDSRSLADRETRKSPAFIPNRFFEKQRVLADIETRKNPAFRPQSVNDKHLFAANAVAQYPAVRERSAPLSHNIPVASADPGRKRPSWFSGLKKSQRIILVALILVPLFVSVFELVSVLVLYKQMQDGVSHLQAAESIFRDKPSTGIEGYFSSQKIQAAQKEIDAAHNDFASLSSQLDHGMTAALASGLWSTQINTARSLGRIAANGTTVVQDVIQTVGDLAPSLVPALQQNVSADPNAPLKPYLTPASYQKINTTLDTIAPLIHSMVRDSQGVTLSSLPLSKSQQGLIAPLLSLLPVFDTALAHRQEVRDALGWFLGIGGQRAFLIEPMDSSELRATGGFTGQFGELLLNGAHVGPLRLANIGKYEENHSDEGSPPDPTVYPKVVGQLAPGAYADWWPVANFGLRDANLSADFPTSAKIAMDRYTYEFGRPLDGVMMFTPTVIEDVLRVTGPITIAKYKQTITAQNLQSLLHYYQLDNAGIRQEEIIEHVEDTQLARKLFTQEVTQALLSAVTHLPLDKVFSLINEMVLAMKSKDLQIYVTNPQLESLIGKYGSTASLDRSNTHDGLFIVQSNLSASKATQYVTTTVKDAVTLDSQGGATHDLTMTLDYQQKGDVYGFDTYRDYVRIYVPENSHLITGNGFDQIGQAYCGDAQSGYNLCQDDVYGDGSLLCAPPIEMGYATSYINDPYAGKDHPLDVTGPPPNLQSDEVGRTMFAGWVTIPKNCTMKVTLSWYVPPQSNQPYSFLYQEQASVYALLNFSVKPSAGYCSQDQQKDLNFSRVMDGRDILFTIKRQGTTCSLVPL